MYTLYLDESGDWGYPNYDVNMPILCLCSCILKDNYYSKEVVPSIRSLKRKRFHKNVVLHRYKIENRMDEFSVLKTQENVDAFIRECSHYIAGLDVKIILSALNKADYFKTYGLKRVDPYLPADIYSVIFTFAIERFVLFLREDKAQGKIIAES